MHSSSPRSTPFRLTLPAHHSEKPYAAGGFGSGFESENKIVGPILGISSGGVATGIVGATFGSCGLGTVRSGKRTAGGFFAGIFAAGFGTAGAATTGFALPTGRTAFLRAVTRRFCAARTALLSAFFRALRFLRDSLASFFAFLKTLRAVLKLTLAVCASSRAFSARFCARAIFNFNSLRFAPASVRPLSFWRLFMLEDSWVALASGGPGLAALARNYSNRATPRPHPRQCLKDTGLHLE